MRVARVGHLLVILAALAYLAAGPASADAAGAQSFKVTISPEYVTAGEPTTFHVTIVNPSSSGTMLGSVKLTPPNGFSSAHPTPGSPLRGKTKVVNRTVSVQRVALAPGKTSKPLVVTTNAPIKCGRTVLPWSVHGFAGATGSGSQLALEATSSVGVTVLCPSTAACGDGGPPCKTHLITSTSTYTVVSNAAAGTLRQTVNVGNQLNCGTYKFRDPNWYDSIVVAPSSSSPTAAPATVTDEVTYRLVNTTAKGVGFCLGAAYDFMTASGGQAPAGTLPNGNPGFIGLLPRCSKSTPPCISSVTQKRDTSTKVGSDVIMKIQIPENGDPWGHS